MKAWRRRVKQGLLAKDGGGAICRHHPRLGRKGKDLILNRKGHINGGPNKKKSRHKVQKNNSTQQPKESNTEMTQDGNGDGKHNNNNNRHQTSHSTYPPSPLGILPSIMAYFSMLVIMSIMVVILFASYSWKGNIH